MCTAWIESPTGKGFTEERFMHISHKHDKHLRTETLSLTVGSRVHCAEVMTLLFASEPQSVRYHSRWLGIFKVLLYTLVPIFVIYQLVQGKEFQKTLPTQFFFSVSAPDNTLYLDDLVPGQQNQYSYRQLLVRESEDNMFVITQLQDRFQEYDGQGWSTLNQTHIYMNMSTLLAMEVHIVARIRCDGQIHSNYPRDDPSMQTHHNVSVRSGRERTGKDQCDKKVTSGELQHCCNSTCPWAGFAHGIGLDVELEYSWLCDLGSSLAPKYASKAERYQCAKDTLGLAATAISSSSIIRKVFIVDTPSNANPGTLNGARPVRRELEATGFQLRIRGTGGCVKTTLASFLKMVAEAVAIDQIVYVLMACGLVVFKWNNTIPDATVHIVAQDKHSNGKTMWRVAAKAPAFLKDGQPILRRGKSLRRITMRQRTTLAADSNANDAETGTVDGVQLQGLFQGQRLLAPFDHWEKRTIVTGVDAGKIYYANHRAKRTQWDDPRDGTRDPELTETVAAGAGSSGSSKGVL